MSMKFYKTWFMHQCCGDLGLLMGKFCQFLAELSARDTIMAGFYRFTFCLFVVL